MEIDNPGPYLTFCFLILLGREQQISHVHMGGNACSEFSRTLFCQREIGTNQQKQADRPCEKSITHGLSETTRTGRQRELNGRSKLGPGRILFACAVRSLEFLRG